MFKYCASLFHVFKPVKLIHFWNKFLYFPIHSLICDVFSIGFISEELAREDKILPVK